MNDGYIKLYRKTAEHFEYLNEKFDRNRAWIDLILTASPEEQNVRVRGREFTIKRGYIISSYTNLARRWSWSRNSVAKFISELVSDNMVEIISDAQNVGENDAQNDAQSVAPSCSATLEATQSASKFVTILKIVNYEKYQGETDAENIASLTYIYYNILYNFLENKELTKEFDKYLKSKKINNKYLFVSKAKKDPKRKSESERIEILNKRKKAFAETIRPFVDEGIYSKDMCNKFYAYWTEPNKSRTKLRFEQQSTWDLALRLQFWADREK